MSDTISMPLCRVSDLRRDPNNAREHSPEQLASLRKGIEAFGWTYPIAAMADGLIRAGNGRHEVAQAIYAEGGRISLPSGEELPEGTIPAIDCSNWSDEQWAAYALFDNKIADDSNWNEEMLAEALKGIREMDGIDEALTGFGEAEIDDVLASLGDLTSNLSGKEAAKSSAGSLSREFLIPPFSVLSAREGWWQDRKKQWLALGIESEVGRGDNLLKLSDTLLEPDPEKRAKKKADAKEFNINGWVRDKQATGEFGPGQSGAQTGTSIFDPVLCEIAYRWFSARGSKVLDPFAGGSVRGIVAAALGRSYEGIDLREEQIEANAAQWDEIKPRLPDIEGSEHPAPKWIAGDSAEVLAKERKKPDADLIFSCPPYGDLEVYSDIETDLSTMPGDQFDEVYADIIAKACARLKDNRFACFVIGDYRNKKGIYHNFVSKTIAAFEAAGLGLYNEGILVTATGSLAIRAGGSFRTTRKLGKTHQNILVFVKGDPRKATDDLGEVDVTAALDPAELDGIETENTEYGEKITGLGGEV